MKRLTHNEYQKYIQENANRLYKEKEYTMKDFFTDSKNVIIQDYDLEKYHLNKDLEKIINNRFKTNTIVKSGRELFEGRCELEQIHSFSKELDCDIKYDGGYNGFAFNEKNRMILEWSEGDIYLVLCNSDSNYKECLNEHIEFYNKNYDAEIGEQKQEQKSKKDIRTPMKDRISKAKQQAQQINAQQRQRSAPYKNKAR